MRLYLMFVTAVCVLFLINLDFDQSLSKFGLKVVPNTIAEL